MTADFNNITIIGVGLIGGSLGLAIKERKLAAKVIGVGRREISIKKAIDKNAVDEATLDIKEGVKNSDLVIIATPVNKVIDIAKETLKYMPENSILIDVTSTKNSIVSKIEECIPENISYIGTHPMAGSEKKGVKFAESAMFNDSSCIITLTKKTNSEVLKKIKTFWKNLGAEITTMSPDEHDKIVSITSHVPHVIASILVKNAECCLDLSGGSFNDITRVALSNPEMWTYIFIQNKKNILETIDKIISDFKKISGLIENENKEKLISMLSDAKKLREKLEQKNRGMM